MISIEYSLADKVKLLNDSICKYFDTINVKRELLYSVEQEEFIIHRAIRCLASISALKFIDNNSIEIERFPHNQKPVSSCIDLLLNIYCLPVCFSEFSRGMALRCIGLIVKSLDIEQLNDGLVKRHIVKAAKFIQSREAEQNTPSLIAAHLWALSRITIDSETRRILACYIDKYVKDLEKRPRDVIIAVCKAVQYLDQPTELLMKKLQLMTKTTGTEMGVSVYATLAWLTMNFKKQKSVRNIEDLIERCRITLDEERSNPEALKACVKCIYLMSLNDGNLNVTCSSILQDFMVQKDICFSRERAFVVLARMSVKFQDEQLQLKLMTLGITHVEKAISTRKLVPQILHGMCIIAMANKNFSKQLFNLCKQVLVLDYLDYPGSIFNFMISYHSDWKDSVPIKGLDDDIFETLEVPNEVFDDAEVIHAWRRTSPAVPVLYDIDMFARSVGFMPPSGRINNPDATIYEDVVACFTMAISHSRHYSTTLPSLFRRIRDTRMNNNRITLVWEGIRDIMGEYAVVSYCQLLFALILSDNICSEEFLREMIKELDWYFQNVREKQRTTSPTKKISPPVRSRPPSSYRKHFPR